MSETHPIQYLDDAALWMVQRELLRRQLKAVLQGSEFYQRKWQGLIATEGDVDSLTSPESFAALPFTSKDELRQSQEEAPPLGLHRCAPREQILRVSSTSGTTGRPLYYALTARDKELVWKTWKHIYDAAGVGPGDLTLYGFAMGGPYGGLYGAEALEYFGIPTLPVGSQQSSDRFIQLMRDLRPTTLTCVSNFPIRLAQQLRTIGVAPESLGIRRLLLGGEPVNPIRRQLEREWHAEVYEMMGTGETGMIWGECSCRTGMHYLSKDLVLVEYIDPETLKPVSPTSGATAELVYTHLQRDACPLVRYRTRDLVSVQGDACGCGRRGPRIVCIGRTDDMLKVRGVNVFPSAIEALLGEFGEPVTTNFRIKLQGNERKFSRPLALIVGIKPSGSGASEAELAARVADYMRANLGVRTEVTLMSDQHLGDQLRGGLDRRSYFIDEASVPA